MKAYLGFKYSDMFIKRTTWVFYFPQVNMPVRLSVL
jgi:hypothetical protein